MIFRAGNRLLIDTPGLARDTSQCRHVLCLRGLALGVQVCTLRYRTSSNAHRAIDSVTMYDSCRQLSAKSNLANQR